MIRRFQSAGAFQNFLVEHLSETDMHMIVGGTEPAEISFPPESQLTRLIIGEMGHCTFVRRILSLPAGLKVLQITDCYDLNFLCDLPATLTDLFLARCRIHQLPALPKGLVSLTLHDSPVLSIPHAQDLPESLTHLEIRRCSSIAATLSRGLKVGGLTVHFEG